MPTGGLEIASISPSSLVKRYFSRSLPEAASRGPYLSIWNCNAKVAPWQRKGSWRWARGTVVVVAT
eukprot:954086-Alexandrium_andersonii.AAC.1